MTALANVTRPSKSKPESISKEILQWYEVWFPLSVERIRKSIPRAALTPRLHLMALSVESLVDIVKTIPEGASILDCGAGASSWFLRHWFEDVTTVEPLGCEDYLEAVRMTCVENGVTHGRWILDLESAPQCDYVIYDYLHTPDRPTFLGTAWEKCREGMYIDDMHNGVYAPQVRAFAKARDVELIERDAFYLVDGFGRWGAWMFKVPVAVGVDMMPQRGYRASVA